MVKGKTFVKITNQQFYEDFKKEFEAVHLKLDNMTSNFESHILECKTDRKNIRGTIITIIGGLVTLAVAGIIAFFGRFGGN